VTFDQMNLKGDQIIAKLLIADVAETASGGAAGTGRVIVTQVSFESFPALESFRTQRTRLR